MELFLDKDYKRKRLLLIHCLGNDAHYDVVEYITEVVRKCLLHWRKDVAKLHGRYFMSSPELCVRKLTPPHVLKEDHEFDPRGEDHEFDTRSGNNSLMGRGYEPGGGDYGFDPRSGNFFFLYKKEVKIN